MTNSPHLALFFTRGMSLTRWEQMGILNREMALYSRLQDCGVDVSLVTHGTKSDLQYLSRFPGMHVLCNHMGLPGKLYRSLLPWLHRGGLRRADVIKTNQMLGADIALRAAKTLGKPLIARCGFMLSHNEIQECGEKSPRALRAIALEKRVFAGAANIVVTTEQMKRDIESRFPAVTSKVSIIPNFVDTSLFAPEEALRPSTPRVCAVGRLAEEKNLAALIEAMDGVDADLDIIGDGPLRRNLEEKSKGNPRIRFLGAIRHTDLPKHLNSSTVFILPSLYEGHPKTLIEAMACGLPVIGSRTQGICDTVQDGENGLLCETDSPSIRSAIMRILSDVSLRMRLGVAAREHVLEHFSLDRIVKIEFEMLREVTAT